MNNPKEYYKATMNMQVSDLIKKFFNYKYNEKLKGILINFSWSRDKKE